MIRRLLLELKTLRFANFVPLMVWWVLLPAAVAGIYLGPRPEDGWRQAVTTAQAFVPLFAVWWPVFIMKEYLNAPGNELLFAHRSGVDTLLARMGALWLWAGLHWGLLCLACAGLNAQVGLLWAVVALESGILIAAAYFLAVLSCNTFLPLMAVLIYCVGCQLFQLPGSIFISFYEMGPSAMEKLQFPLLLAAGMALAGWLIERRLGKGGKMKTFT